ncbi:MAG: peptidoglycan-binding domain-containing protein [bacterium]
MKKLTLTLSLALLVGSLASSPSAEALTPVPYNLSVTSMTQTSMTVNAYPFSQGLSEAINNHRRVFLNYRPTMCGDDPSTAAIVNCPAIYQMPTIVTFGYSPSPTPTLIPIYLTNLTPNTGYTLWLSYDTGIVCITTPCPSTADEFNNRILVTTQGDGQQLNQTKLQFSNIRATNATVTASIGNDEYQNYVQQRLKLAVRYITDSVNYSYNAYAQSPNYMTQNFTYSDDVFSPLPLYLSNLQPNTQYRVWIGYWPAPQPCSGYCTLSPGPYEPVYSNTSWMFTTPGADTTYSGPLTQKLYKGVQSNQVKVLQSFLIDMGFLGGTADGKFGNMTHSAVKEFQQAYGLNSDGRVGPATRSVINNLLKK